MYLDTNTSNKGYFILSGRFMTFWFVWVVIQRFAVRADQTLCCKINDMSQAAAQIMSVIASSDNDRTYLILRWRQGNTLLYLASYRRANSCSVVPLFAALSQVTCPS